MQDSLTNYHIPEYLHMSNNRFRDSTGSTVITNLGELEIEQFPTADLGDPRTYRKLSITSSTEIDDIPFND